MIRDIYLPLRMIFLLIFFIMMILFMLLSSKEVVPFLAGKYLKDFGVEYSSIEGTLMSGFSAHDIKYEESISAKKIEVKYNIMMFFRPTPSIAKVELEGLTINVPKLSFEDAQEEFSLPSFGVADFTAKGTKIVFESDSIGFDIEANELLYDETLFAKIIDIDFRSTYANAKIKGKIDSNVVYADADATLSQKILTQTLSFIKNPPKKHKLRIEVGLEGIKASSRFAKLQLKNEEAFIVQNADIDFTYIWGKKDFDAKAIYDMMYAPYSAKIKQSIHFDIHGKYDSKLTMSGIKEPYGLPFKTLDAKIKGDTKKIEATITAQNVRVLMSSLDYENFMIDASAHDVKFSMIEALPKLLQEESFALHAKINLHTKTLQHDATIEATSALGRLEIELQESPKNKKYDVLFHPNSAHELFKDYNIEKFSPLKAHYKESAKGEKLDIDANLLEVKLLKSNTNMYGTAKLGSTNFDVTVDLQKSEINFTSKIKSLKKLIANIYKESFDDDLYDAKIDLKSTINYAQNLRIESQITLPIYIVKVDTQKNHIIEDISFSTTYEDGNLIIDNYFFRYLQHDFHSKKASKIRFDEVYNIYFEELWLYETILIQGFIEKETLVGNMTLTSESFIFKSADADVKVKLDLHADFSPQMQKIDGKITLIEGAISYKPIKDYMIDDDDIIVIQDIKEEKKSNRSINIQVNALKPIAYKIKDVDLMVTPNIKIFQEPKKAIEIFGVITINEGKVVLNDRKFEFDTSEVYFSGTNMMNPTLNLNLHFYTIDYTDIEIYVTNTLEDPVIILSSKPAMSQNDIMSYILFGEASSSLFDPSSNTSSSSLLLATGLKQLVNETDIVQVDTLNILTNKEGTLGYEIGTRFNEKIRIVYKNDTTSSLILQYSLSKSVRIDVDVSQTGQGVSIIYIKDF